MNSAENKLTPGPAVGRVQMKRAELERMVSNGRPTGHLLRSVAVLKGLSEESLAGAAGIPVGMVRAILDDQGITAVNRATIRNIAGALGIDLATMRFTGSAVHVLDYSRIPGGTSEEATRLIARAAGLLCRDAMVAELKGCLSSFNSTIGKRVFAVQNAHSRVLVYAGPRKKFELEHVPSGSWARKTREQSALEVQNVELIPAVRGRDVTASEFDELFMGPNAPTWDDVKLAARANGLSKSELLSFIRSRGEVSMADGQAERPNLALVKADGQRKAA